MTASGTPIPEARETPAAAPEVAADTQDTLPSRSGFGGRLGTRVPLLVLGDTAVLPAAMFASFLIRLPSYPVTEGGLGAIFRTYTGASLTFLLANLLALYVFDNYDPRRTWAHLRGYWTIAAGTSTAAFVTATAYYLTDVWKFGRGLFLLQAALATVGIVIVRLAAGILFSRLSLRRNLLVVGSGAAAETLAAECGDGAFPEYRVAAFVALDEAAGPAALRGVPVVRRPSSMLAVARRVRADIVVVATDNGFDAAPEMIRDILHCKVRGLAVTDMPTFYKRLTGRVPIHHVDHDWFLYGTGFDIPSRPMLRNLLRLVDLATALACLAVFLPFWVLVAAVIRLDSRGPIFYRQVRLGLLRRPFELIKFRTMRVNAETDGAVWSVPGRDPRVTRVGRLLRRTRLDEVPQLWNVLKGEMSLIGPRPERPEFVSRLEREIPFYDLRFAVRPGLTGWAQVNYRYGASVEDAAVKLQYDLYFMQENSIRLTLHILLKTVQTLLLRPGS